MVTGVVVGFVPACSQDEGTDLTPAGNDLTVPAPTTTIPTSTTSTPEPLEIGVLYVLHAVTADIERGGAGYTLTLEGVERRTQWVTAGDGGTVPTGSLVDQWADLGLDSDVPDAALVPAQPDTGGVRLELSAPLWDEQARKLSYQVDLASAVDPRLHGLVPDQPSDPLGRYGTATLWVHTTTTQTPGDEPPTPTTTTTEPTSTSTTTSTTTSPGPPSSTAPPNTPTSTPTLPTLPPTLPTLPPTLPPLTSPPTSGPGGEPAIVANKTTVRIPTTGGVGTVVLRNSGTGVGSWSAVPPRDVGISVSPSSGLLFPGSSTTVRITYDGVGGPANQFADDFKTELRITTAQGSIVVTIEVAGD